MTADNRKYFIFSLIVALIWLGFLLGVSFLATPVKFLAPSLSLSVALDVGRQTFAFLNPIEIIFVILLIIGVITPFIKTGAYMPALVMVGLLLLLLLCQTFWLLPALDSRVEVILQGGSVEPSSLHRIYIGVDVIKLFLLGVIAAKQLQLILR